MELKVGIQRKVLTPKMAVFEPTTSRKQFLPEKKQEIIMRHQCHKEPCPALLDKNCHFDYSAASVVHSRLRLFAKQRLKYIPY